YSSPQLTTICGVKQCLLLGDLGLTAVDPLTGSELWRFGLAMAGAPRAPQPHLIGNTHLVVAALEGPGASRIEIKHKDNAWAVENRWTTGQIKPEFPDFVVHQGHLYGFDLATFCCLDLDSGKRCWREGRYGRGQVMLLADQSRLLVLSEKGEAVLLKANP